MKKLIKEESKHSEKLVLGHVQKFWLKTTQREKRDLIVVLIFF